MRQWLNRILWVGFCALMIGVAHGDAVSLTPQVARGLELHTAKTLRDVTYGEVDGVKLKMDIYIPSEAKDERVPAVIFIHGGAWRVGDKSGMTLPLLPLLVKRGYIVASINYRLAPEYKFPAQIEDAKCAVRFLRAHADVLDIDSNHIGACGDSAGGHLAALLGLTDASTGFDGSGGWNKESSRVQAVADLFGPTDLTNWKVEANDNYLWTAEHVFGAKRDGDPALKRASPIYYVSKNAPPFFILHGNMDDVIPVSQSVELYGKLKAAGVASTLLIITNYSHGGTPIGLIPNPSAKEMAEKVADFFDETLKK